MRKAGFIIFGIVIAVVAFVVGRWWEGTAARTKAMQEEMSRMDRLAEFDKNMLQNLAVRSNVLTSGTYVMQMWFLSSSQSNSRPQQPGTQEFALHCENGQTIVRARSGFTRDGSSRTFIITNNVVSWTQEGAGYEANAKYVGIVDGDEMWGRVYGWGPGDQSVGFWRIYPKR